MGGAQLADAGLIVTGYIEDQKEWELEPDKSVGGYIILKADDLQSAADAVRDCPIFVVNGTAEIRKIESM